MLGAIHSTHAAEICTFMHQKLSPSKLLRRKLKTKQSPVTFGLYLRKTRAGKSRDYDVAVIF